MFMMLLSCFVDFLMPTFRIVNAVGPYGFMVTAALSLGNDFVVQLSFIFCTFYIVSGLLRYFVSNFGHILNFWFMLFYSFVFLMFLPPVGIVVRSFDWVVRMGPIFTVVEMILVVLFIVQFWDSLERDNRFNQLLALLFSIGSVVFANYFYWKTFAYYSKDFPANVFLIGLGCVMVLMIPAFFFTDRGIATPSCVIFSFMLILWASAFPVDEIKLGIGTETIYDIFNFAFWYFSRHRLWKLFGRLVSVRFLFGSLFDLASFACLWNLLAIEDDRDHVELVSDADYDVQTVKENSLQASLDMLSFLDTNSPKFCFCSMFYVPLFAFRLLAANGERAFFGWSCVSVCAGFGTLLWREIFAQKIDY